MCTAMTYKSCDRYFGRTLDYEVSFGESVVNTPREYPLVFRELPPISSHYAILGMATVAEGIPLYYDAVNENGLAMAGLLFSGYGVYAPFDEGKKNVASFELIPWVLGQCADLRDVRLLLEQSNIRDLSFSEKLPATPLHWMIADRSRVMVAEPLKEGLKIYENPAGVLTNSPPFDQQLLRLDDYNRLTPGATRGHSRGLGAYGLPGDWSSSSRFVRAAFARLYGRCGPDEAESVSHFFRLMQTVAVPKGCVRLDSGDAHTLYTSCCNQDRRIYYYSTYSDPRIMAVPMTVEGKELQTFSIE